MKELIEYFTVLTKKDMTTKQKFQFGLVIGVVCGIAGSLAYLL
ncbi:MAG: hypothetical protein ACOCWM_06150 [Cyclobacteriaceae bacterium]